MHFIVSSQYKNKWLNSIWEERKPTNVYKLKKREKQPHDKTSNLSVRNKKFPTYFTQNKYLT